MCGCGIAKGRILGRGTRVLRRLFFLSDVPQGIQLVGFCHGSIIEDTQSAWLFWRVPRKSGYLRATALHHLNLFYSGENFFFNQFTAVTCVVYHQISKIHERLYGKCCQYFQWLKVIRHEMNGKKIVELLGKQQNAYLSWRQLCTCAGSKRCYAPAQGDIRGGAETRRNKRRDRESRRVGVYLSILASVVVASTARKTNLRTFIFHLGSYTCGQYALYSQV